METYFKFIGKDKVNREFQYHLGLNEDNNPFNPDKESECVKGGLYFSKPSDIMHHLEVGHVWIAEVTIPDG